MEYRRGTDAADMDEGSVIRMSNDLIYRSAVIEKILSLYNSHYNKKRAKEEARLGKRLLTDIQRAIENPKTKGGVVDE